MRIIKKLIKILIIISAIVGIFNIFKPMPEGTSVLGQVFKVPNTSVKFLYDKTYFNNEVEGRQSEQQIFDEILSMIDNAQNYILIDLFLFNDYQAKSKEQFRLLSKELTDKIVEKKKNRPDIEIIFITDPINNIYGAKESQFIKELKDANVNVVITDLTKLRDSNPIYSGAWRSFLRYLPVNFIKLPNPFVSGGEDVGLGYYFKLINFKANHRKVVVAGYIDNFGRLKMSTLVTSANPHDGSSAHHNVAIKINDFIWQDVVKSEKAVADFSGYDFIEPSKEYFNQTGDVEVQLLTEKEIKNSLVDSINKTGEGDSIKMVMFYISDRDVVKAIKNAHKRGVKIDLIFDPNKDAFGREKNGVPNVSVAKELIKSNQTSDNEIKIRWCDTHGEQCHSKLTLIEKNNSVDMFLGSANLTKRNIGDYNLETNVKVSGGKNSVKAISDAYKYFEMLWSNNDNQYTTSYDKYKDESIWKTLQYRIMEKTGISSF